jgi:DNA-directed RNA polymerase subunit RPC12/RpoP
MERAPKGKVMPYREVNEGDRHATCLYVILANAAIVITGLIIISLAWPVSFVLWLAVFVTGIMYLLVRWHASATAYRCPACNQEFEISALTDALTPHVPDTKYLKCPQCGKWGWAAVLMKAP